MTDEILKTEEVDKKPKEVKEVKKEPTVKVKKYRNYGARWRILNVETGELKEIFEGHPEFMSGNGEFEITLKSYKELRKIKKGKN